ncbi:hypothetical protein K0M31_005385 [Melipona bicolor]|uniref:Uncharacterized protein n=1 Tax=Melipona bicolor TaxID=60889 RepID=A0AA40FVN8_9HYME|nr:hypothetical protein K0M31_005385 [Melipona bicolor]
MADEPEAAANEESAKRKGFPMAGSFVVDSTPFCRSVRFVHEEKSNKIDLRIWKFLAQFWELLKHRDDVATDFATDSTISHGIRGGGFLTCAPMMDCENVRRWRMVPTTGGHEAALREICQ